LPFTSWPYGEAIVVAQLRLSFDAESFFGDIVLKVLINCLCLFLALSVCVAQSTKLDSSKKSKPDLNGTWVLDDSRSNLNSGQKDKIVDYVLHIVHREPEIRIVKKYKQRGREFREETIYYTDGKPEFSSRTGRRDPEPITRWRGDKLVRKSTARMKVETFPPMEIVTSEEWELSSDGKTLTRTITNTGLVFRKLKYVFIRSS
jgi:hypothetical protein